MIGTGDLRAPKRAVTFICVLLLAPVAAPGQVSGDSAAQAVVTYGFLRSNYPDFDQLLSAGSNLAIVRDFKSLETALESLGCDVPTRLAFPHRSLLVDAARADQWIRVSVATEAQQQQQGTLFVRSASGNPGQRVWVVLSSVAPQQTTVFWIEARNRGYGGGLVYDSFKKGRIANAARTAMGAVIALRIESDRRILVEERAEPGSRPGASGALGRVFEVDLTSGEVTLKSPGVLP